MVKRIIWTNKAEEILIEILEYYHKRNGNKIFSRSLYQEVMQIINLIRVHPFLGRELNFKNIRVIVSGFLKIFYKIEQDELIILLVWDSRRNPDDLNALRF